MKRKSAISVLLVALCMSAVPLASFAKRGGGGKPPPPPPPSKILPVIAFVEYDHGISKLQVANEDGANRTTLYTSNNQILRPKFSPTENEIVFEERDTDRGGGDLKLLRYSYTDNEITVDSKVETLVTDSGDDPAFGEISPDGNWLLYKLNVGNGNNQLFIQSMNDPNEPVRYLFIGDEYIHIWDACWLSGSLANLIAVSYNDYSVDPDIDELIVIEIDLEIPVVDDGPIEIISSIPAGLTIEAQEGVTQGVVSMEAAHQRNTVIVNIRTLITIPGRGKKIKTEIQHVVYEWNPFFIPGEEEFAAFGSEGNRVLGSHPAYSADDLFVLGDRLNGGSIYKTEIADPSNSVLIATDATWPDWKP